MTPQLPTEITASGRQPLAKMTIAFLLDDHDETGSISLEATRDCCDSASPQAQTFVAHPSPWIQSCDQTEVPRKLFKLPSLQTSFLHYSNGHYTPQALSEKSVSYIVSSSSGRVSSCGTESRGCDSGHSSSGSPTDLYEPSSSAYHLDAHHNHRCHDHPAQIYEWTEVLASELRCNRPSYNEEQKFFIVHHRIIKKLSWPEVENEFAKFFKLRSKDGLTSVYYRTRESWGMEQVLKNEARCGNDLDIIEKKADHFSRAFLENIGYFD